MRNTLKAGVLLAALSSCGRFENRVSVSNETHGLTGDNTEITFREDRIDFLQSGRNAW